MVGLPIRVLIVGVDESHARVLHDCFHQFVDLFFDFDHVSELEDASREVRHGRHEIYLVDHGMGDENVRELLEVSSNHDQARTFVLLLESPPDDTAEVPLGGENTRWIVKSELSPETLRGPLSPIFQQLNRTESLRHFSTAAHCLSQVRKILQQARCMDEIVAPSIRALGETLACDGSRTISVVLNNNQFRLDTTREVSILKQLDFRSQNGHRGQLTVWSSQQYGVTPPLAADETVLVEAVGQLITFAIDNLEPQKASCNFLAQDHPYPVFRITSLGEVVFANAAALPLLTEWNWDGTRLPAYWVGFVRTALDANERQTIDIDLREKSYCLQFHPSSEDQCVNVYGTDITHRKQIEQTLRERARLAAMSADVGIILTRGGNLNEVLQGCASAVVANSQADLVRIWLFLPKENTLALRASAGLHTRTNNRHHHIALGEGTLGRIAEQGKPSVVELLDQSRCDDDMEWAVELGMRTYASFPLIVNNYLLGVLGIFSEATFSSEVIDSYASLADVIAVGIKQRKAELSQSRLVAMLEATPDFVAISDAQFRGVYLNRAARQMLAIAADEDLSKVDVFQRVPDWARELIHTKAIPALTTRGVWRGELAIIDRHGNEIPVSQVIQAHYSANGEIEFYSTLARDISDSRKMEEQLRQSQKLEAIGRLAGGVAHDFNNLLTGIQGFADLALQSSVDQETFDDLLQIRELCDRSSDLTRQLLAFSRRQPFSPTVVNINSLVERTSRLLQRLIGEDIELVCTLGSELAEVRVDPGQIEQILINLAVNARDAMPQGGRLAIQTRNVELSREFVRPSVSHPAGGHVLLSVTDNGCGMEPAVLQRVFEPFFTTKPVDQGTGLGLSTVYGIVKQHQGDIWVYSEPNKGTTFKVYFPIAREEEPVATQVQISAIPRGSETILVVEDEVAVREVTRRILEGYGYHVYCAANALEALELLQSQMPALSLVLTDVVMPGTSGPELFNQLRELHPHLKVLFMSGYPDESILQHGVLEQGTPFIEKPFVGVELVTKIRNLLDG